MRRGKDSACSVVLDGAGKHGFAAAVTQHRLEQKCRCRLAVGSGDAAEFELRFGMSEEICSDGSQRTPPMRDFHHRDGRIRGCGGEACRGIGNDGSSTLGDCLRQVSIAIRRAPAKGDKERAVTDSPRVILDARDLRVGPGASHEIDTAQNAIEIQGAAHASLLLLRLTKRSAVSVAETDATLVSMNPRLRRRSRNR